MARPSIKKKKAGRRRLASWVLGDLYRLADVMRAEGRDLDSGPWLKVGANILSSAPAGREEITRAAPARWGLDQTNLLRFATRCGIDCSAEDIACQVAETTRWRISEADRIGRPHHYPMSADTIGKLLGVTEDERRAAKARRIGTVDGSRKDRIEAARELHAERQARRRRESGAMTRDEYIAKSLSATRPWEAEGVSRRTWERRRNKGQDSEKTAVASPCAASPCANNKESVASPCANNLINTETAGSGYALPSRHHPANAPPPESFADTAGHLRRRQGFEPVTPYTINEIQPGGVAARLLERALRNPPIRNRFRNTRPPTPPP